MTIKNISLTIAERQVVTLLLTGTGEAKLDTARKIRTVRKDLKLKDVERAIEKMGESNRSATWDDILELEGKTNFTTEEDYLRWLQETLQSKDWARVRTQQGQELNVAVPLGQLEAAANLADALADALSKGE